MRRNLLIIMSDEHRADAMGCAGHPFVETPNLDALAAGGTRFTDAYTPSPICVPARAAFATGRHVHDCGYWDNSMPYLGAPESWGHVLQRGGVRVESIGKLHYRQPDDDVGFDRMTVPMMVKDGVGMVFASIRREDERIAAEGRMLGDYIGPGESNYTRYDTAVVEESIKWFKERAASRSDQPWCLYVGMVAPHFPLVCPEPYGSVSEVYAWAADCCGEAGPRRCPPDHADEMEPSQIAVQVLRGDAAIAAQETLQLAVAAIDRLNVEGIPDPLSGRKVQGFVANAHGRSAGRIAAMTVRNQNDVGIQNRFEHRLQGLGVDRRKNLADGCAAAIGGDQDRHLFIRQAALAGLAATLARLAIQSARSLVALKHVSLVNFDNALEFRPILACGLQETVPPAEGRIDAKSASTGRFPYRLALGQRHAE